MEYSEVQSVIFKKPPFKKGLTQKSDAYAMACIEWLYDHGFKFNKIDEKEHYYRFRQTNPNKYTHYTTKEIDKKKGIKFIIGWI
jgi:16S rRNA G966 N2-methylase RsmD